jgi:hypothetical protein
MHNHRYTWGRVGEGRWIKQHPNQKIFKKKFNESNKSKNWRPLAIFLESLDPSGKKKSELLSPMDFKPVCIYVITTYTI